MFVRAQIKELDRFYQTHLFASKLWEPVFSLGPVKYSQNVLETP